MLGLIDPQYGNLKIDETIINNKNRRSWQNTIGFVAQSIFLSEGSIAENVAFGIPKEQISFNKVHQALKLAHLDDLIKVLKMAFTQKLVKEVSNFQVDNDNVLNC